MNGKFARKLKKGFLVVWFSKKIINSESDKGINGFLLPLRFMIALIFCTWPHAREVCHLKIFFHPQNCRTAENLLYIFRVFSPYCNTRAERLCFNISMKILVTLIQMQSQITIAKQEELSKSIFWIVELVSTIFPVDLIICPYKNRLEHFNSIKINISKYKRIKLLVDINRLVSLCTSCCSSYSTVERKLQL